MTPETNGRGRGESRRTSTSILVVLGVLGGFAFWIWSQGAERRAIRRLPEAARTAAYERTLENVRTVCAAPELALEDYCREQAVLLLEFPECDEACHELANGRIARRAP